MDDPEFNPEELTPQQAGPPVAGEPEGNVPLEDVQANLDAVMESLDHELPEPNLESTHDENLPDPQAFDDLEIPAIDELNENPLADDPFVPPTQEVQDLAQHDQDLASELESLETAAPTKAEPAQDAPQPQPQRGFSFPGLPSATQGAASETMADPGYFTQQMEQEGAGRDAQSFMFRAETRHHGLMNEAMIEYARTLEMMSDAYERWRL